MTSPVFADPWYIQLVDAVAEAPLPVALCLVYWFSRGFLESVLGLLDTLFGAVDALVDRVRGRWAS